MIRYLVRILAGISVLCGLENALWAQDSATIHGEVISSENSARRISGARIVVSRLTEGTKDDEAQDSQKEIRADENGNFKISSLITGRYKVVASALGFSASELVVDLLQTNDRKISIALSPAPTQAGMIEVTGQSAPSYVTESPVKVDVITSLFFERNVTSNLMEAIQAIPGLYQQIDCGICYTNNIRINGMEGPYTAILIDGTPIIGALGSVYGLNGINPALIERLEIIKGPSSTIHGSEAMGGVINIVTKDARFTPRLSLDINGSSAGEQNVDIAVAQSFGNWASLVSGNLYRMPRFVDRNGDNFSDVTIGHRIALFGKLFRYSEKTPVNGVTVKLYDEERFGGVEEWTAKDKGSDRVYGEFIKTRRAELLGYQSLGSLIKGARMQLSASAHHQDSYYGDTYFRASQEIIHTNMIADMSFRSTHNIIFGAAFRFDNYRDNSPVDMGKYRRFTPGVFVEDEISASENTAVLLGARIDHHKNHGFIFTPRASVKWSPKPLTTLRINTGTGFRVVNLFTEDHAALSGARTVTIPEKLAPERSASISLNVNQIAEFGVNNMMIDVDAFYTRFSNKITPDYDQDPTTIVYNNLDGHAVTRGLAIAINQNFARFPFLYSIAATVQDVYIKSNDMKEKEFFAPKWKGNVSASYSFASPRLSIDYTGIIVGSMRLPEYSPPFDRPTRSPLYSVHDIQTSFVLPHRPSISLYSAVKNVFNYTQGSPIVDAENPFSEDFDPNYVWGPIQGRRVIFGMKVGISR